MSFDVQAIREEFPILQRQIDGKPLVYLDNAATTQKPQCVIDAIVNYYTTSNANVHRGAHRLADEATRAFEGARDTIASFINAPAREEVIWTAGTTESINIIAHGLTHLLTRDDEIIVTTMEHHANLVTWQQACQRTGATLKIVPMTDEGELDLQAYEALLSRKTKLVAFPHVSNALGTVNPINFMTEKAKEVGAWVLIDGAQGIAHFDVDVQAIGCDFYAFSAHKLYGPMGMGVLWGRKAVLEEWPVWQTGGEMISTVTLESSTWNVLPYRFEAGTPNVADAIAFGEAVRWFNSLDQQALHIHEQALMNYAVEQAIEFEGLTIIGQSKNKVGALSFILDAGHPADIGFLLDRQGIAIRTGDHCAQPIMNRFSIPGTARASFAAYTTFDEIDALFLGLHKVKKMLA